jgi:hypothetical protein
VSQATPSLPLLKHTSLFCDSCLLPLHSHIKTSTRLITSAFTTSVTTHSTNTTNNNIHIKMSAIAKPVTILAGLLVAGTATTYTVRSKNSDFSAASLAASDMDAAASAAGVSKPKL